MSWPSNTPKPQPSPEWIKRQILHFAKRVWWIREADAENPLWSRRLKVPSLGPTVFAEVMPTFCLRVRDRATNEILVQSLPFDFSTLDTEAPETSDLDAQFEQWRAAREFICRDQPNADTQPTEKAPGAEADNGSVGQGTGEA